MTAVVTIAILHMPDAIKIPLATDQRINTWSIGSFTAPLRRMIARAPTTPMEAMAFWLISRISAAVTGAAARRERLKLMEYRDLRLVSR